MSLFPFFHFAKNANPPPPPSSPSLLSSGAKLFRGLRESFAKLYLSILILIRAVRC